MSTRLESGGQRKQTFSHRLLKADLSVPLRSLRPTAAALRSRSRVRPEQKARTGTNCSKSYKLKSNFLLQFLHRCIYAFFFTPFLRLQVSWFSEILKIWNNFPALLLRGLKGLYAAARNT